MPAPFFPILTQTPSEAACPRSSHSSHSAAEGKASCGRRSSAPTPAQASRAPRVLGDFAEGLRLGQRGQLADGVLLDLARPLAGDAEHLRHLVEPAGLLLAQPPAELDDPPLAVGEGLERLAQAL